MNKLKSVLTIVIMLALMSALLVACGGADEPAEAPAEEPAAEEPAAEEPAAEEPAEEMAGEVALRWRTRPDNQAEIDVYQSISDDIDAAKDNLTLTYEPGGSETASYQDVFGGKRTGTLSKKNPHHSHRGRL